MDDSMIESLIERRTEKAEKLSPLFAANWPEIITQAASRPNGARFYRCALQVNTPFQDNFKGFDSRHRRGTAPYQRDYALALAKGCKKFGIDAIGLCDHNSVDYVETVRDQLGQEGIIVFPGFEVASTEGIHLLCLFDPSAGVEQLNHLLTQLGLPPHDRWTNGKGLAPRQSPLTFPQLLEYVQGHRQGICIAAHVERENGLLYECAKTTRAQYFTDPNLLAAQIAGRREDLKGFYRKVIDGEYEHYQRQQLLALINCLDVYNLKDLGEPVCSTWIKMSSPSIEGLWQAFLDPDSRLRLLSEEPPEPHTELVAVAWQGGFLDGGMIHFNENLNCLIGGRGAGKSTVIESLRYILDLEPIGDDVRRSHAGILQQVLRTGTHISLLVHSHSPSPCLYLIERTYPEAPSVRDEQGNELPIHPGEILPGVEIFGQHEIAEIAKDPPKQYQLLRRFRAAEAAEFEARKQELLRALEGNRLELAKTEKDIEAVEEKLNRLPAVEEKLRRYKKMGIETKLNEQSQLTREESIIKAGRQQLPAFKKGFEMLHQAVTQIVAFREGLATDDLPNHDLMERVDVALANFEEQARNSLDEVSEAWKQTEAELLEISKDWEMRRQAKRGEYEKMLRELHKEAIDGAEFMKLRKEYEMLVPLQKVARKLQQQSDELLAQRHLLLEEWEETKSQLFEFDQEAADKISEELAGRVRARVVREFDLNPLFELLKRHVKGLRTDHLYNRLHEKNLIALADFIQHIREGKETLCDIYELQAKTATALAGLSPKAVREMEELELPTTIYLELNVAHKGQTPNWKVMQELSTGQKATVILLLLLLERETPLVIDQPEDDLDNSFIAETIIPTLRQEKRRRQFLFATHNANLPVLGDAELIVTLEASGEGETGNVKINDEHVGSIDQASVKFQVEQILEGGKQAFEMRRAKYGF
jgi:predicted ATPase